MQKITISKDNLKKYILWIPVLLAYYPAIMSYDFHRQSQEVYQGWIWF